MEQISAERVAGIRELVARTQAEIARAIVGKAPIVELLLVALLCEGHVLLEDVPGTGKTTLARAVAAALGCSFQRIQFTPDLLPSDVTGLSFFNQKLGEFQFRQGPVFAQVLLTEEINRATPKTQSSLLEAMEERQITVDGVTHKLPAPFIVLATQNPIEYEGTFPLPEAQLDRFLLRLQLGYPERLDEIAIFKRQRLAHPLDALQTVAQIDELLQLQQVIKDVYVDDLLEEYIVGLVTATRHHEDVYLGASARGSLALYRTAQAWAAIRGQEFVTPDDVKFLAGPVLCHRMIVSPSARIRSVTAASVIEELLSAVPVPGARAGRRFDRDSAMLSR